MKFSRSVFAMLLVFVMLFSVACSNSGVQSDNNGTTENLESGNPEGSIESSEIMSDSFTESETTEANSDTDSETETVESEETNEETTEIIKENEALEMVDFIVSVPEGREPVILQLTDPQIIDASQARTADRLGGLLPDYWGADKKNVRCYDFLREIITNTDPDLIIVTGDIIYGEFDDSGKSLLEFIQLKINKRKPISQQRM